MTLDIADLTSHKAGRAVAVVGRTPGPNPRATLLAKEWLRDFGTALAAQVCTDCIHADGGGVVRTGFSSRVFLVNTKVHSCNVIDHCRRVGLSQTLCSQHDAVECIMFIAAGVSQ